MRLTAPLLVETALVRAEPDDPRRGRCLDLGAERQGAYRVSATLSRGPIGAEIQAIGPFADHLVCSDSAVIHSNGA